MKPDPLPTCLQRKLLCDMIHTAFVHIRMLGWNGEARQAADLADAFHNIPKEMYGWGWFQWNNFRRDLAAYQTKWPGGFDYVKMLDEIRELNAP